MTVKITGYGVSGMKNEFIKNWNKHQQQEKKKRQEMDEE